METEAKAAGRLADLYVRHLASARRLAYLVTGDRALAEDLVQDAFLRMFGRFQDLRDPGAFEAYLRRTVVNLSRKHFRRRKVERAYVQQHGGSVSVQAPDRDVAGEQALRRALLALLLELHVVEAAGKRDIARRARHVDIRIAAAIGRHAECALERDGVRVLRRGPGGEAFHGLEPEDALREPPLPRTWLLGAFETTSDEAAPRLRAVLATLPPRYVAPLTLFYLEGMDARTTADVLGLPLTTVKWRLRRAQALLRQNLPPPQAAPCGGHP